MEESIVTNYSAGSRSESRTILDKYFSVQFSLNGMGPTYLFKLWDISFQLSVNRANATIIADDTEIREEIRVESNLHVDDKF